MTPTECSGMVFPQAKQIHLESLRRRRTLPTTRRKTCSRSHRPPLPTAVLPARPGVASPFACVRLFARGEAGPAVRANCVMSAAHWSAARNQDRPSQVGQVVLRVEPARARRRSGLPWSARPGRVGPEPLPRPRRTPSGRLEHLPRPGRATGTDLPRLLDAAALGVAAHDAVVHTAAVHPGDRGRLAGLLSRAPSRRPRGGGWAPGRGR